MVSRSKIRNLVLNKLKNGVELLDHQIIVKDAFWKQEGYDVVVEIICLSLSHKELEKENE